MIGIRVLHILETIHNAGFVYNDLKLDNLVVGDFKNSPESMNEIRLVDFGFVTRYLDKDGKHLQMKNITTFRNNLIFCSIN